MRIRFRSALVCAAWLTGTAAMAQASPPSAPQTVALTTAPGDAETQAYRFVQSYAATTAKIDQIARWDSPICVQVVGLVPDKAAEVKARIEDVAKALEVSALPAGCTPNIEIMFTAQPQRLLDGIAERQEVFLGYHHRDTKTAKTVTYPIQAWYVTETVGGAGPNAGAMFSFNAGNLDQGLPVQSADRVIDDPDHWTPTGCGDNHFTACLKSVFGNVLVVVDMGRMDNANAGLVSDYVSMLALSQPRALDRCNVLPSVTDLFVGACPGRGAPDGLTPADAAYLTSLYAADPEARKLGAQADIAGRMAKILATANVAAR